MTANGWPWRRLVLILALVLNLDVARAAGQQLPVITYGPAEGLASRFVHRIRRDSRGFLWFTTREGLSRYDGHQFVSYAIAQGLPTQDVIDLLETRDGGYWVATNGGGVARFLTVPGKEANGRVTLFEIFTLGKTELGNRTNALREDAQGRIWAGTDGGAFMLDRRKGNQFVPVPIPTDTTIGAITEDASGTIWLGGSHGLFCVRPDGRVAHVDVKRYADGTDYVWDLLLDGQHQLWIASPAGAFVIDPAVFLESIGNQTEASVAPYAKRYSAASGLDGDWVNALYQAKDGAIWLGTQNHQLYRLQDNGLVRVPMDRQDGVLVQSIVEDLDGHLWVATRVGVTELVLNGFTIYGLAEGLAQAPFRMVTEDREGHLLVGNGNAQVSRLDGGRFKTLQPVLPSSTVILWASPGALLDTTGVWWVVSSLGTFRFTADAAFSHLQAAAPFTFTLKLENGRTASVQVAYEDHAGNVWLGLQNGPDGGLAKWNRSTGDLHVFTSAEGYPEAFLPTAFVEDAAGALWIGNYLGGLARFQNGRFSNWTERDGAPSGMVTQLLRDHLNRLWMTTSRNGISRVDTNGDRPAFTSYTRANRLTSNDVRCVVEDAEGRLYLGTGRGIDRLNPETGEVTHHNLTDAPAGEFIMSAYRDRHGVFWFGTEQNLLRYEPQAVPPAAVRMYVSGVSVSGVPQPVATLGEVEPAPLSLGPEQNDVSIEFFALGQGARSNLRYQYRLSGQSNPWLDLSEHAIHFGRLAPGSYRVEIQALVGDRVAVERPAVVAFVIAPPFYARAWFIALVAAAFAAIVSMMYRARVRRAVALERMRTRIATDLHDDIGANLTQISILSELARQKVRDEDATGPLDRIGMVARDSVDAMGDIVWAISARHDRLEDLVSRVRRTAADIVEPRGIRLIFRAPERVAEIHLDADFKRQVFLIAKEAVNNAARHAACTEVRVDLQFASGQLVIAVSDNGRGLPAENDGGGHGLDGMRTRAASLGGRFDLASRPGEGTVVTVSVPLRRHARGRFTA